MTAAVLPAVVPAQAAPPKVETPVEREQTTWHLVDAAQAGDRDAFADLYRRYQPLVFNTIYRRTGRRELAADLTQDVFVRALRNLGSVTWQGRDIGAWLVVIARNIVVDHYKSHRYKRELPSEAPGVIQGVDPIDTSREGDPAGALAQRELSETIAAAMSALTEEQRWCLQLRFFAEMSVAETARTMGKNEGAVKALQYRAVQALARLLPPGTGGAQ